MLFALPLLHLVACDHTCESLDAGLDRDRCVYEGAQEVLPTLAAIELERLAQSIDDPAYRATLVHEWVRHHRGGVRDADRDRVCGLLGGMERHNCVRDLMAAHLNR